MGFYRVSVLVGVIRRASLMGTRYYCEGYFPAIEASDSELDSNLELGGPPA